MQPLLGAVRSVAGDRDDLRAEVGGTIAGFWAAAPEGHLGHELVAAGLTLAAGEVDDETLARWVHIGHQRGNDATRSYDPSRL